jgi:amino acid permease
LTPTCFWLGIFLFLKMAEHDQYDNIEKGGQSPVEPAVSAMAGNSLVEYEQLHRGMKSRHIQFMALGGA